MGLSEKIESTVIQAKSLTAAFGLVLRNLRDCFE